MYVPSSHSLSYLAAQGECLFLSVLVRDLWKIAHTPFAFRPVNAFDLSGQLKTLYVYTGVIKTRHCFKLNEMRLGYFSLGIYRRICFQLY